MAIYFFSLFLIEWKYTNGIWEIILIFISTNFLENGHICVQNGTKLLNWNAFFFFNPLDYINMAIYFCSIFLIEWKYINWIWEVILFFISINFLENGHICVQNGTKLLTWNAFFFFNPLDFINMAIYFCSLFLIEWKYINGIWEVILIFIFN